MSKKPFEISIDHAMMARAKASFDSCLRIAVTRAIRTGSNEGSAALKISFEIMTEPDQNTGEIRRIPEFKYRAGYSVPIKESIDAKIEEDSRLMDSADGWKLVTGQISIDEMMEGDGQ